jgi:hypothetical protein
VDLDAFGLFVLMLFEYLFDAEQVNLADIHRAHGSFLSIES